METKSTILMATIRMDKTTTISATIQQEQQQKQKKNPVPPILFHQPKTKQKSCSTNFVPTNKNKRKILLHQSCFHTIPKQPQLIQTQQEQRRQRSS